MTLPPHLLTLAIGLSLWAVEGKEPWRMLAPVNTTVSLFCYPLLQQPNTTHAKWFRDGKLLGEVTQNVNLVVGSSSEHNSNQDSPDVGLLIISNISKADGGSYWCETGGGVVGKVVRMVVAFMDETFEQSPGWVVGQPNSVVTLPCHPPHAYPTPTTYWTKDGKRLSWNPRAKVSFDGSLRVFHFGKEDAGRYTCVARNIAGVRSVHGYIVDSRLFSSTSSQKIVYVGCSRSAGWGFGLWFLAGVLTSLAVVLCYSLFVVFCARTSPQRRRTMILHGNRTVTDSLAFYPAFPTLQ